MNSLFTGAQKLFACAMRSEINADAILRTVTKKLFTRKSPRKEAV